MWSKCLIASIIWFWDCFTALYVIISFVFEENLILASYLRQKSFFNAVRLTGQFISRGWTLLLSGALIGGFCWQWGLFKGRSNRLTAKSKTNRLMAKDEIYRLAAKSGSNRSAVKGGYCGWDSASLKGKGLYKYVKSISGLCN